MKWALPFHNCITCCMTTPQKLACWLLHSDAACGQANCKPPGRVQLHLGKLDICSSHVAHVAWQMWCQCQQPRLPYLECPKSNAQRQWAVFNSDELSTTRQIVVVEHWLLTSQSSWRHGCVFPYRHSNAVNESLVTEWLNSGEKLFEVLKLSKSFK